MNGFVYEMLHGIAKKRWEKIKDNPEKDWKVEWEKFRWKRLAASDFEKRHLPDFRNKAEAARKRENAARHYSEFDFMLCWYFLGAEPEDYFSMVFPEKGWIWRNHHVTRMRMNFLKGKLNPDPETCTLLNDKAEFCRHWGDEIHRRWCVPEEVTKKEFVAKFTGAERIITKKRIGFGGKGIVVFDVSKMSLEEIYDSIYSLPEQYIVEEYHRQTGWLAEINPSSLNTIRVATIRVMDQIEVIFSYLRVGGKDAVVDNLHSGGIRFPINRHSGEILPGMNYETHNIKSHPGTGSLIAGVTIPGWENVLEYCRKAHQKAPESLHWIGWDVCLDEDDIFLIEGNAGPGFPPIENPRENWWGEMKKYLTILEKEEKG